MEAQSFEAVVQALREWRQAHPQATFDEIDAAVQRHFAPVQAQVVAELSQTPREEREGETQPAPPPRCPQCGQPMQAHGARRRRVPTRQGQVITLRRAYYGCPACSAGLFPLDEALGLGGGRYSPQVLSWLARLGATLPFAQAADLLQELTGTHVSAATVRRQSETPGGDRSGTGRGRGRAAGAGHAAAPIRAGAARAGGRRGHGAARARRVGRGETPDPW